MTLKPEALTKIEHINRQWKKISNSSESTVRISSNDQTTVFLTKKPSSNIYEPPTLFSAWIQQIQNLLQNLDSTIPYPFI